MKLNNTIKTNTIYKHILLFPLLDYIPLSTKKLNKRRKYIMDLLFLFNCFVWVVAY